MGVPCAVTSAQLSHVTGLEGLQVDENMKQTEKFVLLDVREPQEFVDVFVPGSVRLQQLSP
jgi:hypothetical protein